MNIGIMGAMKEEVGAFIAEMQVVAKETRAQSQFYVGKLAGSEVVVVHCGVGKVNAACVTQILIDRYQCQSVLFTGLAGSGRSDIAVGDFVVAESLVQHDFDLRHFGREKGMIPAVGKWIKADGELNAALVQALTECAVRFPNFGKWHRGVIASGDCFIADSALSASICSEFNALAVEMEGAAMAQVCFLNRIPFAVLRTVSDNADEAAAVSFDAVLQQASVSEVEILKTALRLLKTGEKNRRR